MARRALVTGGNRGIGRATAEALISQGMDVAIAGRDLEAIERVAKEIGAQGEELDVTSDAQCYEVAGEGNFDVLVNNAGVLCGRPLFDDPRDFESSIGVMLRGPYHLIKATLPGMGRRGYGRIVNISSGWGSFAEGLGGPGAYGIAKAALNALTVAAARAAPAVVKINAMDPGWVRTSMGGPNADRSPEDAAADAVWLATLPDDGPTGGFFRRRQPAAW